MSELPEEDSDLIIKSMKSYDLLLADEPERRELEYRLFNEIGPNIKSRGFMKKDEGKVIFSWRQPTRRNIYEHNTHQRIEKVTRYAFETRDEELRLHILTNLRGIALNNASKILAVVFPDKYAMFSYYNWQILQYWNYINSDFFEDTRSWYMYISAIREFADSHGIDPRTAEKILNAIYLQYELKREVVRYVSLDKFF